jgi:hypothetical protein
MIMAGGFIYVARCLYQYTHPHLALVSCLAEINAALIGGPFALVAFALIHTISELVEFFLDYRDGLFTLGEFIYISLFIIFGNAFALGIGLLGALAPEEGAELFMGAFALSFLLIWDVLAHRLAEEIRQRDMERRFEDQTQPA